MALPIAVGNTLTTFANGEFTVAAGATAGLFIIGSATGGIPAGVDFELARKTAGGAYITLITLNASNIVENGSLSVPGVYAVRRLASESGAQAGFEATGTS